MQKKEKIVTINIKQIVVYVDPRPDEETKPEDQMGAVISRSFDMDEPEITIRYADKPYKGLHERGQLL